MEVYKYRIKRTNPSIYWTVPCTGGTDFWPINLSTNCSGITMFNSTFSQVRDALEGDMNNFPQELTGCSIANPCVILNDTVVLPMFPSPDPFCIDSSSHPYILFTGLNLIQMGVQTFTGESYNDMISVFDLTNSTLSQPLNTQTSANLMPNSNSCFCQNPLGTNLNQIPILLDQDFNDIGHYDIWDGNIGQKDIFSNFVVTATTTAGNKIKIFNSTDFGYYKTFQDSPYTINWGDCNCNCPVPPCVNSFGDPCCETLQFPNLTNPVDHTYGGVGSRKITITHESPWGPTSVSQMITVPFMNYNALLATGNIPSFVSPVIGPNGPVGTNSYFGAYPSTPLDSGTDIMQYSGMSPIFAGGNNNDCFDVTGNTESLLGAFQNYTTSSTAGLPPGYQQGITVPLMGQVLNPITNTLVQGVSGKITQVNAQYTAYTISIGTNTPITFYDFSNGVTLYEAVSCGLDAFAFAAFDCVKCELGDCTFCETKDEYIDRITFLPHSITFTAQRGEWLPTNNYVVGDIVFDSTWGECCCYMAVKDITQSATTVSPWAGVKPTDTFQGVWWYNGQPTEHIWEACSPICETCPDYTAIPCYDPTNWLNAYPTFGPPGPAGVYSNGNNYTAGTFTLGGPNGNCYRALQTGTLPPPTGLTNNAYWDYIGCSSWICPPVSALTAGTVACELVPGTGSTSTGPCTTIGYTSYNDCFDDFLNGECCEDRYICTDQYSCQGCTGITSAHPLYNDPSGLDPLQGPVFDSMIDCNGWCNPPAFSCTTQIASSNNCCVSLSCAEDNLNGTPGYYSSVVLPVIAAAGTNPAPFSNMIDYIASNYALWFVSPLTTPNPYDINDCNLGVVGIATACCDYTIWVYNCEDGCIPAFAGAGWSTPGDCWAANPQWAGYGTTPCGWICDPVCEPCVEVYQLGVGYPYTPAGLLDCEMNCSCVTNCYICDCTATTTGVNVNCDLYYDPITNLPGCPHWPPNEGIPVNVGDPLTYLYQTNCLSACTCEGGIDCFISSIDGTQMGGCSSYPSLWHMAQQNATWSLGSPTDAAGNPTGYTTVEECCLATECCWAVCEEDPAVYDPAYFGITTSINPALQGGGGGTYPCWWYSQSVPDVYSDFGGGQPSNCCSPLYVNNAGANTGLAGCIQDHPNHPYCDMIDCINSLCPQPAPSTEMMCCVPPENSCICACDTWITQNGSILVPSWEGPWNVGIYLEGDTVSYGDGNTADCCWICTCPYDPLSQVFGSGVFDCSSSPPDDGPYSNGQPNCWQTCERLPATFPSPPSNIIGDPCGPCSGHVPPVTYSCSTAGCSPSTCDFNPGGMNPSIWATQMNCYDNPMCDTPAYPGYDQCRADCYCADPNPLAEVTSCTVLQDYLNDIYSPGALGGVNGWIAGTGWYSTWPMTYPPVQPGLIFNTSGSFWWQYSSFDDCVLGVNAGVDCCDTSGFTYACDDTCNCPTVNGNPCVGGTGCYVVTSGPPGPFTSMGQCQAWCTWECDPTGPQICIFNALSTAVTTYPSALACSVANTNCECVNGTVEYWCDWAGADAGYYNTLGAVPCVDSVYMSTQVPAYQAMAIGQGATGPADPANNYHDAVVLGNNPTGQGFPTLQQCQEMCRFCCDCAPPGSGICDLCGDPAVTICSWGDQFCSAGTACQYGSSYLSPYDCQQNTTPYPCAAPITEYCCHAVDGCLSYMGAYVAGTNPVTSDGVGCVSFHTIAGCDGECNFVCGDCTPTGGQCDCTFVNTLTPNCLAPYPFTTMADCQFYLSTTVNLLYDAGSCCRCYDCFLNSPITYSAYDVGSSTWITMSTPIPTFTTSALVWLAGTQYNTGDVVSELFDGDDCCYVCVWGANETGGITTNWTWNPSFYYTAYVNDVGLGNPVWPGGGTGSLAWIPCDAGCVNVQITTYNCIPGAIFDSCKYDTNGNVMNLIVPTTVFLSQNDVVRRLADPLGTPNLQSTNIFTIKFPYGGWPVGYPANPCLYNGFPLAIAGGFLTIDSDMAMQYSIPQDYVSWSQLIAALVSVGVVDYSGALISLTSSFDEVCEAIWLAIGSMPGSLPKCITITLDPCECTQSTCDCVAVNGPGGQFPNLIDCQSLLNNVPCCGTWYCPGQTNCTCVFQPNILTGFATQMDCYNAVNCCEIQEPEYACIITAPSPAWGIPDVCDCIQTPGGPYTGPNALLACQTDPTTCCSGTTMPDYWKCELQAGGHCHCVIDPSPTINSFTSLLDCQSTPTSNCCYTGVTKDWECIDFGGTIGCECVQTATGSWPTSGDCEAQQSLCCYSGVTKYDCKDPLGNGNCTCVQSIFGFYTSLYNCEHSIPAVVPHPNCCEKVSGNCKTCDGAQVTHTTGKHYGPLGGLGIASTNSVTLAPIVDRGLWVTGTNNYVYLDVVEDPADGCCYALIQTTNHSGVNMLGPGSPLLTYSPSIVYNNHINGYFADGSYNSVPGPPASIQQIFCPWWPCDPDCAGAIIGYDCDNCPGTCVCNPNNTAGATFQGPGALAACQAVCIQGCDDCAVSLAGYLTGPIQYEGVWSATYPPWDVYDINDCVVDPADNCCYCCVEDPTVLNPCTPNTPPQLCKVAGEVWHPFPVCKCKKPNIQQSKSKANPCIPEPCPANETWFGNPICDCVPNGPGGSGPGSSGNINGCASKHQPSLNLGVSVGGVGSIPVTWADCKQDINGDPCGPGGSNPICKDCGPGAIQFDYYDHNSSSWQTANITAAPTLPIPVWTPGTYTPTGQQGNVVMHNGCCFVVCNTHSVPSTYLNHSPTDDYMEYLWCMSQHPGGNPLDWPTLMHAFGANPTAQVVYFPCDVDCVPIVPIAKKRYDCKLQPTLGNPNNMGCVSNPNGVYVDLPTCQINCNQQDECKQCCQNTNWEPGLSDAMSMTSSYTLLQSNANPCDCEFWLGVGWVPVPLSKCKVRDGCVQVKVCDSPYVWAGQPICDCVLPNDIPHDDWAHADGCVQDTECENGWTWSWKLCDCVIETRERCIERECAAGKFWDKEVCNCVPHKKIP